MLAQRAVQQSMRRLALHQRTRTGAALTKLASPAAVATNDRYTQKRLAATQNVSEETAQQEILVQQRLLRPVSPHLGIYQPQVTWTLSALNRITGSILSGGLYVYAMAYLAAPALGWHLGSATLAAGFAAWPLAAKVAAKFLVATPFTFHCFNGLRHLAWDFGKMMSNKLVQQTGWVVVGLTVVSSLGLAMI